MSHVTITDPHHSLFGRRLEVLKEPVGTRSRLRCCCTAGRTDERRGIRIASTGLTETSIAFRPNAADLPRISVPMAEVAAFMTIIGTFASSRRRYRQGVGREAREILDLFFDGVLALESSIWSDLAILRRSRQTRLMIGAMAQSW